MPAINDPHLAPRPDLRYILDHLIVLRPGHVQIITGHHQDRRLRTCRNRVVLQVGELVHQEAHVECRYLVGGAVSELEEGGGGDGREAFTGAVEGFGEGVVRVSLLGERGEF